MMTSLLSTRSAVCFASRGAMATRMTTRTMAVTTLSDVDAVEKFRITNHKSVLYFTASWCQPCRNIKPLYEKLSEKYTDVAFGKVDVDENSDAALDFEVSAVPTFVLFENEHATEKWAGADEEKLERHIQYLNNVEK